MSDFMMSDFMLTPELTLPGDAEGHRISILGTSGACKTSAAKVIVEALIGAGRRVCVLDPSGVWWGLKLSADGRSPGLPVVVFGGRRADVPLEASAGAAVADLSVDEGLPVVLDLSGFEDDEDVLRVAGDVVRRLRFRQDDSHDPLLLVVDEADLLAPQTARRGYEQSCQSALRSVARRGRSGGLGLMTITQRPVGLHTDIVSMAEASLLMRFTGDNDLKRIKGWLGAAFGRGQIEDVLRALPGLADGEAFAASPGWLKALVRTRFPFPGTFDSSAAPKAGSRPPAPGVRADVDLSLLAARFATAIEVERENDPEELKRRISALQAQMRDKPAGDVAVVEKVIEKIKVIERIINKVVEVPVFREGEVERLSALSENMIALAKDLLAGGQEMRAKLLPMPMPVLETDMETDMETGAPALAEPPALEAAQPPEADAAQPPEADAAQPPDVTRPTPEGVGRPQQMILNTLADLAALGLVQPLRAYVALFAGVSPGSSAFGRNLGALRSAGLLDYPADGLVRLTPEGSGAARPTDRPLTREALQRAWLARLAAPQRRIMETLIFCYPRPMTRAALAGYAGVSADSSAFGRNLGALRSLGLVSYPNKGEVAATVLLFPEGLPEG